MDDKNTSSKMPDPIGLSLREIKLVDHDHRWFGLYEAEAQFLSTLPHVQMVEHIGSTAIPGLKAKPVIDIAVKMDLLATSLEELTFLLVQHGCECHGEYGLPGRIFFTLGNPPRFHIHVVGEGSEHWTPWLVFRDYLRKHPEYAARYEQEKIRLAKEAGGDRSKYTMGKGDFVKSVLSRARHE